MNNELSIDSEKNQIDLETNNSDRVATTLKAAFGLIPGVGNIPSVGPVLAELVGVVIPNQKIDRLKLFAEVLDMKVSHIEKEVRDAKMKTEEFTDLLEDALRQASRALTDERREYIASLLKNSLDSEDVDHLAEKKLLSILNELNDAEIIFLRSKGLHPAHEEEFYQQHEAVMAPIGASMNSPRSEHDKNALRQSYQQKLRDLGLVKAKYKKVNKGDVPEYDQWTGERKVEYYRLTGLGKLLLRYIDHPSWDNLPDE